MIVVLVLVCAGSKVLEANALLACPAFYDLESFFISIRRKMRGRGRRRRRGGYLLPLAAGLLQAAAE